MAHLCVPQNQALGVCRGFAPDIQICGTHGRKNLVNATIISNADEEEEIKFATCIHGNEQMVAFSMLEYIRTHFALALPTFKVAFVLTTLSPLKHKMKGRGRQICLLCVFFFFLTYFLIYFLLACFVNIFVCTMMIISIIIINMEIITLNIQTNIFTVSSLRGKLSPIRTPMRIKRPCAVYVHHIWRLSLATCVQREGTTSFLLFAELKSNLFQFYFVGGNHLFIKSLRRKGR